MALRAQAQSALTASARTDISVYAAPAIWSDTIGQISPADTLQVAGRSVFGHWLFIQTEALSGWVAAGSLDIGADADLWALPVIDADIPPAALPTLPVDTPEVRAAYGRLLDAPLLDNMDTSAVRDIFARGQELGNRANVFTRVGDSNTTSGGFLNPMGLRGGRFCQLGVYSYLQQTLDFFSQPPQRDEANSFDSFSVAAVNGLSTASLLDPFWADPAQCRGDESPLACELRLTRPSVVLIMLGLMDVEYLRTENSRDFMRQAMDYAIAQGVIPVWTTFPVIADLQSDHPSWEVALYFNNTILDVVEEYQTPLINLWAAVQSLPANGIGPDRIHVAHEVGAFCDFTGAEQRVGGTLWNLLTLQALDLLRRAVLSG
ncbi:MAG: hypothetical protein HXY40_16555 [Chloroflexi bacterium]|nr:hypothetical protein [Chloroflexota bacterium]